MHGKFLAGPTASGKTAVAHYLAQRDGFEILSADSMLIYRGMDVGTAKPSPEARAEVRYYGIDLVDVADSFNAWQYRAQAVDALQAMARRHREAIIVGGTGLYLKLLTHGLADVPGPNREERTHWEEVLAEHGPAPLAQALQTRSPALYAAIDDSANGRRLVRFLEWAAAGLTAPPSSWQAHSASVPLAALHVEADLLKSRIEQRVRSMYARGLLNEVRGLLSGPEGFSYTARQAIGYAEAIDHLEGRCSREEAIALTAARTRRLAKRQRTWLRNQADVRWIDVGPADGIEAVAEKVRRHWDRYGPIQVIE